MGNKTLLSLFTTSLLLAAAPVWAATLTNINTIPGWTLIYALAMNANGEVLIGGGGYNGNPAGYSWENGTFTVFGFLPGGTYSDVDDISDDGLVIVGSSETATTTEAFRWENGVMTGLGFLPGGSFSYADAISGNGLVIGGTANNSSGYLEAFRWENGVMTGLGFLGTGTQSGVNAINYDGSVIVGSSHNSSGNTEAYRWENGIMTGLGFLGTGVQSIANAVSSDGLIIAGSSRNSSGNFEAFRWENGIMTGLGFLGTGNRSSAYDMSADGSVIVGTSTFDSSGDTEAFRWTQATGMQSLRGLLSAAGLDVTNWVFEEAEGVSDDGNMLFGSGYYNGTGTLYLVNLASGGLTTPVDMGNSLNTVAQASQQVSAGAIQQTSQGIFAAQNLSSISTPIRIAMSVSPEDIAPAAGDFETVFSAFILGSYGVGQNNDVDNDQWNGTVGISAEVAPKLNIGFGFIAQNSHQELDFDGESDLDAYGGIGLLSYEPGDEGLRVYATAYAADLSLEIERGYMNGSGLDSSRGDTDGVSYGTAIKIGWEEEVMHSLTAMPYIEGRVSKTKLDAYAESGGAFDASFSKQDRNYAASRLGIELDYQARDNLELLIRPTWGRRLSGDGGSFTADVSGLSQSLASDAGDRNWAELTIGAKYQATEDVKFTTELTGRSGDTSEPAGMVMFGSSVRF